MRYREITDGTTTISLIAKSGLMPVSGNVASRDPGITRLDSDTSIIAETYTLNMKGVSQKDLAVKCQQLVKLLRKAMNYKKTSWQRTPVYIKEKLKCEEDPRYALCLGPAGMNYSDLFEDVTETQNVIVNIGITLIREHPWRAGIPGTLPSATLLTNINTARTNEKVSVANYFDYVFSITNIYNYDSSLAAWSANLAGTATHVIWSVAGSIPAAGDIYYIGSTTGPIKNIIIPIGVAGAYNCDIVVEYGKGGGAPVWTALTDGVNYTRFPTGPDDDLFKIANTEYSLNILPPADFALCTVNAVSAFWIRVRINAFTAWTTTPITQTQYEYLSRRPYMRIGDVAIQGDSNALSLMRLYSPTGGGTSPTMGTMSRIIIGMKKTGTNFYSHLNLGNAGLPAGWATTYGVDSAAAADVQSPSNARGHITFATNTALIPRITLTGTSKVLDWRGRYKAFLRVQQIGGANGDCRVQLRTMIGGSTAGYPLVDNETIALQSHDLGWELVELAPNSFINIPFSETEAVDTLTTNLIFIVRAERVAGVAELRIADLILIPIDEWFIELRDPISDVTSGGSALRGDTTLDVDGGVIADRALKQLGPGTSGTLYPAEYWLRSGENLQLRPQTLCNIYFLMAHYPTTFGTGPLIASLGMQLFVSIYPRNRYHIMGDG